MAGKKILLVEDDTNLREIYGARLQAEGYEIVSAPDGENALAIAVKEKPDLIISDIMMPKVSGFDMLDILRNAPETKDTKIIMMTALSQAEDKTRADKLGADMYLVKSQVTLEDVTKAVHKILDEPSDSSQEADSAAAQEMVSGSASDQKKEDKPEAPAKTQQQPKAEEPQPASAPVQQPAENDKPDDAPKPEPQPKAQPQAPPPQQPKPEPPKPPQQQPEPQKQQAPSTNNPVSSPPAGDPGGSDNTIKQGPTSSSATDAAQPTPASGTTTPVNDSASDNSSATVEPNLAQALEDEEKAVQEKIEDFEKSDRNTSGEQSAAPQQQSQINTETLPAEPKEQPSSSNNDKKEEDKKTNPLDDKPDKKVIEPINDLSKGPDINELVAKEEAKEASNNAAAGPPNSGVVKPQKPAETEESQNSQTSDSNKNPDDEFGKISL